MFNTNSEVQERGQVGIGTLIVFIALVLVAAIAAGVLINTAGFLQSQAEATGQESTEQVSNSLQTTVVTGTTQTDGSGSGLTSIEAGLKLAPGSDPISTSGLTVQVFAEGNSTKRITSDLATSGGNATVTDGSSAVDVIDESQSYVLLFETDAIFGDFGDTPTDGLPAGNDVIIEITTASGSQTRIEATAPDPISGSNSEVILE